MGNVKRAADSMQNAFCDVLTMRMIHGDICNVLKWYDSETGTGRQEAAETMRDILADIRDMIETRAMRSDDMF